jgi:hypothetical protein
MPWRTCQLDSAMPGGDGELRRGEAKASPSDSFANREIGLREGIENASLPIRRDTNTRVAS